MYCQYCGAKIADDSVYCPNCGKKVQPDPKDSPAAIYESIYGKQGGEKADQNQQSVNQKKSTVKKDTERTAVVNNKAVAPVKKGKKNTPKNNKKEEKVIIPDSELTNDEMDVLNIRMSYFTAGTGGKDAAVSGGMMVAMAVTNTYGWSKRAYTRFRKTDYQKQYDNERNRIKRIIVASRNKSDKITYQSLGYKKICNETYYPIRGDLQIEPNREELLNNLQECYTILDNSDKIQSMAVQPMQKSAELYMRRFKLTENIAFRVIVAAVITYFTIGIGLIFVIPMWKKQSKKIQSERQEMQDLDAQAVEYIQAACQYVNDNFGIFYMFQSKYWNKDSVNFLYDAIINKRECGTWGQALNSLDAYLARVDIQRRQDYQTAIMEKAASEAQRAADAAEDAALSASIAASRS